MTVQTFLKAAQAAGLAHNSGAGGQFILVATGPQLESLERALAVPDAAAVLRELVEAEAAYTHKGRVDISTNYEAITNRYFDAWAAARAFPYGVKGPDHG